MTVYIEREPRYYGAGHDGKDIFKAPFFLRSLVFDGKEGDFNAALIKEFNSRVISSEKFRNISTDKEGVSGSLKNIPRKVVIVNASFDGLPESYETARLFRWYFSQREFDVEVKVVNSREEVFSECSNDPPNVLLVSQCVNREVYNVEICEKLEKMGVVTVPGKITAPGSVFSDKDATYRLLSEDRKKWDKVARYIKVAVEDKNIASVVEEIFEAIDKLGKNTGERVFFIKPNEGGGGLGGFRITKTDEGYIIPDLSKVSGIHGEIHPTYIEPDTLDPDKMMEVLWVYRLFAADKDMAENYLKVKLPVTGHSDTEDMEIIKNYLEAAGPKRAKKLEKTVLSFSDAKSVLVSAIAEFERKFKKRYIPLVNEHLDFGLWGLRAHYRISKGVPVLESMYHRIFQLAFTPEGMGYLGADNISNKQTGQLEIQRLGPINEIMVRSLGGEEALMVALDRGAEAIMALSSLLDEEERMRLPLRAQMDIAAPAKRIGEGNADTARGICLASRWEDHVADTRNWAKDILEYYDWKRT